MIGQRIGQYRVIQELGRGGMGLVYEAQHETMPSLRAAIKVLYSTASAETLERFEREARVLSTLQDSGIVRIEDFGRLPDGSLYLRMEYLEGETLEKRLRRLGRLPGHQALELTRQMATTLDRIHRAHILHRDLKPANVMIVRDSQAEGEELARLLDFGIAKLLSSEQRTCTAMGQTVGTPLYMSPEQGDAQATLTDRSDVYQLGLLLYEMLSGRVPFEVAEDSLPIALHIQRLTEPPVPLRRHLRSVPPAVEDLVLSMLSRSPQARPSMRGVAQRIRRLLRTLDPQVDWNAAATDEPHVLPPVRRLQQTGDVRYPKESSGVYAELAAWSTAPHGSKPPLDASRPRDPGLWGRIGLRSRVASGAAVVSALVLASLSQPLELTDRGSLASATWSARQSVPPLPTDSARSAVPWNKLSCATVPPVEGMVCIAGGLLVPGATEAELVQMESRCRASEAPARCEHEFFVRQRNQKQAWVPTFQLDQHETTNAQYADFLNKELAAKLATLSGPFVYLEGSPSAALKPSGGLYLDGDHVRVRPGAENQPVSYVTWYGAERYCQKRGLHLPTELQFEFAARGSVRRPYPWGAAAPTCGGVSYARDRSLACAQESGPREVGRSLQDQTPEGVFDLAGNVQEWVGNDFDLHLPLSCREGVCLEAMREQSAGLLDSHAPVRSVRGGTWVSGATQLFSSWRSRWDARMADISLGFRCAATLEQSPKTRSP